MIRLHRIFTMQSAAADAAAELTLDKMMDEHVTLTLRSCFFNQVSADEPVIKGKAEVMRYLTNDGFSTLGVGGTPEAPKPKGEGCTFVQPCAITPDGDTRVIFGAGGKEATGSTKDRLRVGELIKWGPWGVALSIVRVFDPLPTHYEWVMRNNGGNFAGVRAMLAPSCKYYTIIHHHAPAHAQTPPFAAKRVPRREGNLRSWTMRCRGWLVRLQSSLRTCSATRSPTCRRGVRRAMASRRTRQGPASGGGARDCAGGVRSIGRLGVGRAG